MELVTTENPTAELIKEIRAGLKIHNRPYIGDVKETPLAVYVKDESGTTIAGVSGDLWGVWLSIKYLWVSPELTKQGLGSKLIKTIEGNAINLGGKYANVETFSFQAKDFYLKNGYEIKMTFEKFPVETQLHYLTKTLVP